MKERLTGFFTKFLSDYIFVELSGDFLDRLGVSDILSDIPVPIKKEDMKEFASGGMSVAGLGERMVFIIGCDPNFRYANRYKAYLRKAFDDSLLNVILTSAGQSLSKQDNYSACINYRAAIVLGGGMEALFGYALSLRNIYIEGDDENEIGNFKAESIECFERLTLDYPEFAPAHYYLGYAYLNMGLYIKAKIVWEEFVRLATENPTSQSSADSDFMQDALVEINGRLLDLQVPVLIEEGCNHVMAGRFEKGIEILEPFVESKATSWWPFHYYLGVAYFRCGILDKAESKFKDALKLNPSNIEVMRELEELYRYCGNDEMAEKYMKKADILDKRNIN